MTSDGRLSSGRQPLGNLLTDQIVDTADRNEAVALLEALLTGASTGPARMATVSGAVGSGKSTVLHAFAARAVELGASAVVAAGSRAERNLPMGLVSQLFANASLPAGERSRAAGLLSDGASLPADTAIADEVRPADAQRLQALCTILTEFSERCPLAIVVDDVHHADQPSLLFFSYLARRARSARMTAVFGYAAHDAATEGRLYMELLRSQHDRRIRLSPMSLAGVREMAASRVDAVAAERLAATWHSLSGGNPLLLSGLIDDHQTAGNGEPLDEAIVGDGYGRAVASCLQRGDERTRAVGRGLAVLDDPDPVDRLLGVDSDTAARAIRALTRAGVLSCGRFRHPAARSAALGDLDGATLADLHRRAASLRYERGGSPRVVAEHLRKAGGCDEPWAVPVLEDAARQALREGSLELAAEFLRLAGQACTDERSRGRVMAALVRAEWQINPGVPARCLGQLASTLRNGQLPGKDAVALAGALLWHGSFATARDVFAYLDGVGGDQLKETRAELAITRRWLRCTFPRVLEHPTASAGEKARQMVTTVAQTRRLRAVAALTEVVEQRATDQTIATVERVLHGTYLDEMNIDTVEYSLLALIYDGRAELARRWCDLFVRQTRVSRAPTRLARLTALRGEIAFRLGDLPAALHHARRALEIIPPSSWGVTVGGPLASLLQAATAMGRYDEANEWLDQPVPEAMFETRYALPYLHACGQYSLATGQASLAMRDFRRCGGLMSAWQLDVPGLVAWRIDAAEAGLAGGAIEQARQLLEEQLSRCEDQPRIKGMALRLYAAVRPLQQRPIMLRHAVDLLQSCGDRYHLASALMDLTEAYEAVNEHRRAATVGGRARAVAQGCHAKLAVAAARGATVPSGTLAFPTGTEGPAALLSSAERRVASLAAAGYTNREISTKLYVTVSTVEQHLTRIYRKLNVTSRSELPSDLDLTPVAV